MPYPYVEFAAGNACDATMRGVAVRVHGFLADRCVPRLLPLLCALGVVGASWPLLGNASCSASEQRTRPVAPEVLALFARMRDALGRLKSVEYRASIDRIELNLTREPRKIRTDLTFAHRDGMHVSSVRLTELATGNVSHEIAAFDGETFQLLDERALVLELSSRVPKFPYVTQQPIVVPFFFLLNENEKPDLPTLLDARLWNDCAVGATLSAPAKVDGHPCEVVVVPKETFGQRMTFTVYAATDLEWFPIKSDMHSDVHSAETLVSAVRVTEKAGERVVVPTVIHVRDYSPRRVLEATTDFTVDPDTVVVNGYIPRERFSLPRDNVRVVIDGDTGRVEKTGLDDTRATRWKWGLLTCALVVVALLATPIIWRMRAARR